MKNTKKIGAALLVSMIGLVGCGGGDDSFTITHQPTLAASKMDHTAGQPNFNNEVLRIINGYRTSGVDCGGTWMPPVGALKWNDALRIAAMTHAVDLANSGIYSHTGSDGSLPPDRAQRAGHPTSYVGENVANSGSYGEALIALKNSPGHCKNMMRAEYSETAAANYSVYFVNLFGRP